MLNSRLTITVAFVEVKPIGRYCAVSSSPRTDPYRPYTARIPCPEYGLRPSFYDQYFFAPALGTVLVRVRIRRTRIRKILVLCRALETAEPTHPTKHNEPEFEGSQCLKHRHNENFGIF
ncbi:hypothetical protein SCHPADRAFT_696383 [Schizopora paradoxa]|uniref:Uncharacterized protein n=1 Tax=Schizopora paradoxa TaxID=27342 RepID=A0A0H2R9R0_9AGAM|nr:hypothetical protein SCHPADRAFT_696383 [Schizopora paradoxa]